jgi:TrmH family RNA methyltransferase
MTAHEGWRRVLADIGRARTPLGRRRLGLYSIEGTRLHERALRARVPVRAVLAARRYAEDRGGRVQRLLEALQRAGTTVHVIDDAIVERLIEGRGNGAIVGLVELAQRSSSLARPITAASGPAVVLAAIDVEEPGNVGALARTALAGGAVLFAGVGISDPYHPKAVRTSMGAIFRLPVATFDAFDQFAESMRGQGVRLVAASSRGGRPVHESNMGAGPLALMVGSESFGLDGSVEQAASLRVSIPMPAGGVDSFSVNAAAAILLYEARRPR